MVADGHTGRVANVDLSRVIIEYMAEKYAHLPPAVSWDVADVTALDAAAYADASFDAVIDKGTMDALMARVCCSLASAVRAARLFADARCAFAQCGGDSVGNTNAMAREMMRVLRPGGVFIMVCELLSCTLVPLLTLHVRARRSRTAIPPRGCTCSRRWTWM